MQPSNDMTLGSRTYTVRDGMVINIVASEDDNCGDIINDTDSLNKLLIDSDDK